MADKFGKEFAIVGAVALVKGRLRTHKIFDKSEDILDSLCKTHNFVKSAPFEWVTLIYRYGIKNDLKVDFKRINKKDGDLPIALELDMEILKWADQNNLDLLKDIFTIAALEAVIQVAEKYKLPDAPFRQERSKYGNIPNTIEECETYQSPIATDDVTST